MRLAQIFQRGLGFIAYVAADVQAFCATGLDESTRAAIRENQNRREVPRI
jgi:hypothetical protein